MAKEKLFTALMEIVVRVREGLCQEIHHSSVITKPHAGDIVAVSPNLSPVVKGFLYG